LLPESTLPRYRAEKPTVEQEERLPGYRKKRSQTRRIHLTKRKTVTKITAELAAPRLEDWAENTDGGGLQSADTTAGGAAQGWLCASEKRPDRG